MKVGINDPDSHGNRVLAVDFDRRLRVIGFVRLE